jgi:hypothetical protein
MKADLSITNERALLNRKPSPDYGECGLLIFAIKSAAQSARPKRLRFIEKMTDLNPGRVHIPLTQTETASPAADHIWL